MRTVLRLVLLPVFHLILWLHEPGDDWEEVKVRAPAWRFGAGSRRPFSWYFEGSSAVQVSSVDEVIEWLAGCEYVRDKELFQEDDFWQHPRTLEHLRKGDCEDFALWAWRKLNELGISTRLFVGKHVVDGEASLRGHAWVVFDGRDGPMLFETTQASSGDAIRSLDDTRAEYRPHFSVDGGYRTTSYSGWLTTAKEDRQRRKRFGRVDVVGT